MRNKILWLLLIHTLYCSYIAVSFLCMKFMSPPPGWLPPGNTMGFLIVGGVLASPLLMVAIAIFGPERTPEMDGTVAYTRSARAASRMRRLFLVIALFAVVPPLIFLTVSEHPWKAVPYLAIFAAVLLIFVMPWMAFYVNWFGIVDASASGARNT